MDALTSLTALHDLDIDFHWLNDGGARALANLTQLRSLRMTFYPPTPAFTRALSRLTQLRTLELGKCRWPLWSCMRTVQPLPCAALVGLTQLCHLSLRRADFAREDVHGLATLAALTTLRLPSSTIIDTSAAPLSRLSRLQELDLSGCHVGEESMAALSELTALRKLSSRGNRLGQNAGRLLQHLTRLTTLDVCNCGLAAVCVGHIAGLTGLRQLNLAFNTQIGRTITALSALTCLQALDIPFISGPNGAGGGWALPIRNLTALCSLGVASATRSSLRNLQQLSALPHLQHLVLSGGVLGESGARALLRCTALRDLCLAEHELTPAVVAVLSALTSLQRLHILYTARYERIGQEPESVREGAVVDLSNSSSGLTAAVADTLRAARAVPLAVEAARMLLRRVAAAELLRWVAGAETCALAISMRFALREAQ
jgi:hypothetical protein